MIKKVIAFYKKAAQFVMHDVWHMDISKLRKRDLFFVQQLKILTISVRGFFENRVALQSAALTFYTIMAVVPLAAIVFAISKGFGMYEQLHATLLNTFENQEEVINWILGFAEKAINTTKGGVLGSIGIVFLLWSVIKVMNNIEKAFNRVWQVKKSRPWARKFTDYLAVLIIVPILLVAASTISYTIRYHLDALTENIPILSNLSTWFGFLLPYLLLICMFTVVYMVIPFTKVRVAPAFYAAVITGIAFLLLQNLYVYTQLSVSKYNAIYAAFAILPLFLLWVNISWTIVLLGAELSFAYQNVERYSYELTSKHISPFQRKLAALMITHTTVKNFIDSKPPLSSNDLSEKLKLPVRLVRNTINDLVKASIFTEVVIPHHQTKESVYQPAMDVHKIDVGLVVHRIETLEQSDISERENHEMKKFITVLNEYEVLFKNSPDNKLLMDM